MTQTLRRVLVADDDPKTRSLMARLIQRELGLRPHVARDGGEALFCLEEADYLFDLVVVDADMPGASGTFVLTAIDAIRPEIPIVVIGADEAQAAAALECGADVFVTKPFRIEHMARVLRDAVARPAPAPSMAQGTLC